MAYATVSVDVDISLDEFDDEDIIEAAEKIVGHDIDGVSSGDREFLFEHFSNMEDAARSAGDMSKAFRFERYRELFR